MYATYCNDATEGDEIHYFGVMMLCMIYRYNEYDNDTDIDNSLYMYVYDDFTCTWVLPGVRSEHRTCSCLTSSSSPAWLWPSLHWSTKQALTKTLGTTLPRSSQEPAKVTL